MIKGLLMRLIARNKEFILSQVLSVKDLMRLLMGRAREKVEGS